MTSVWEIDGYKFINKNQKKSLTESKKMQAIENLHFYFF